MVRIISGRYDSYHWHSHVLNSVNHEETRSDIQAALVLFLCFLFFLVSHNLIKLQLPSSQSLTDIVCTTIYLRILQTPVCRFSSCSASSVRIRYFRICSLRLLSYVYFRTSKNDQLSEFPIIQTYHERMLRMHDARYDIHDTPLIDTRHPKHTDLPIRHIRTQRSIDCRITGFRTAGFPFAMSAYTNLHPKSLP